MDQELHRFYESSVTVKTNPSSSSLFWLTGSLTVRFQHQRKREREPRGTRMSPDEVHLLFTLKRSKDVLKHLQRVLLWAVEGKLDQRTLAAERTQIYKNFILDMNCVRTLFWMLISEKLQFLWPPHLISLPMAELGLLIPTREWRE